MTIFNIVLDSPLNKIVPHLGCFLEVELPGPQEPEEVDIVELQDGDFIIGLYV